MTGPTMRMLGYVLASFMSIAVVGALIMVNWWLAFPGTGKPPLRMRWHVIARTDIPKATQIKADNVTWRLGRVPETAELISTSQLVVGKYAVKEIAANTSCGPDALSNLAPAEPPADGAVVPVEIKTSDAGSLKPDMRLAFVQNKVQIPSPDPKKGARPGLLLLSMATAANDAAITTLTVQIEKADLGLLPALATGQWRPIILGATTPHPAVPEQKKKTKKPRRANRRHRRR